MTEKKRLLSLMLTYTTPILLTKDICSYAYALSRYCDWDVSYLYFSEKQLHDAEYERYVSLLFLGSESDFKKQREIVAKYCIHNACKYDAVMLFNYGSATYRLARVIKKYNPDAFIWCKLDMSETGFKHFYDGTFIRKLKVIPEYFKTRNIDLFTVENHKFYKIMQTMKLFSGRIEYLPNCASMLNIDLEKIDAQCKENIIITVGRLNSKEKNIKFLLDAVMLLPESVIDHWKLYLVGPSSSELDSYIAFLLEQRPEMGNVFVMIGELSDRRKLYELYSRAKIFCMTSPQESFGIATVEAMYFGAWPVITYYGSIADDITDQGKYGRVVRSSIASDFANALMYELNFADKYSREETVRSYARKRFSYKHWAVKLDKWLLNR